MTWPLTLQSAGTDLPKRSWMKISHMRTALAQRLGAKPSLAEPAARRDNPLVPTLLLTTEDSDNPKD